MESLNHAIKIVGELSPTDKTTLLKKLLNEYGINITPFYCVNCGYVGGYVREDDGDSDDDDYYRHVCKDCENIYCYNCIPSNFFITHLCNKCQLK